jgi:L(+)-tartrate dehydratase beta subunit
MAHYDLTTPLSESDVRRLNVRDTVTIQGHIFGIRDATQIRIFDQEQKPPADFRGAVCIHTAPSLKKTDHRWEKICIGTTTSTRMERFTPPLKAMRGFGTCYLAIVGGAAALETTQIEEVEEVHWEDLHPEAIYKFRVRDFGPLIVAMDSHGNNLYFDVKKRAVERLPQIYKQLGLA